MPSEAKKYWQYSQECSRQAIEAETPKLRDQLLDLARVWAEAALLDELNVKHSVPKSRLPQRSPNGRTLQR
jgi:hypothetical protein